MSDVSLRGLSKSFGAVDVIPPLDLTIEPGEFIVFVGPSGCGKSTLLRMIAGLEPVSGGQIHIGGRNVTGLAPAERGVAMVFQNYALYPHMTVEENIGFGLKIAGVDKATRKAKVGEAARILRLEDYLDRKPKALSGGQRQRVAIGRAIVKNPRLFLFDEPLSNLDAELRVQMRFEIAKLHQDIGATMIYVTHDQVEAMTLADRIVVLRGGKVEQVGRPIDLYQDPDNLFVAGFIGSPKMSFTPTAGDRAPALGDIPLPRPIPVGAVTLGVRPEHIRHAPSGLPFAGRISAVERLGHLSYLYVRTRGGAALTLLDHDPQGQGVGDEISFALDPGKLLLFDADGRRIRVGAP